MVGLLVACELLVASSSRSRDRTRGRIGSFLVVVEDQPGKRLKIELTEKRLTEDGPTGKNKDEIFFLDSAIFIGFQ